MALVGNGIYGYKVASNATLLGSLPKSNRNFMTNALTWSSSIRQYVSFPYGYYTRAFIMPLKYGAIGARISTGGTLSASISAIGTISATIVGSGNFTTAKIARGVNLNATLTGGGSLTNAQISAIANMKAVIRIGASPSAFDIAQAVWTLQAAGVDIPGTTGEKINSAGAAGNPWTDTADYAPGTKGNDIKLIKTLGLYVAGDK